MEKAEKLNFSSRWASREKRAQTVDMQRISSNSRPALDDYLAHIKTFQCKNPETVVPTRRLAFVLHGDLAGMEVQYGARETVFTQEEGGG